MTITRREFSAGAGALLGSAALPGLALAQFTGDAEKALYEAAKKEGELTWYTAHYAVEQAEEYGREFTAKYPGVKCNVIRTTAHVAYQRLAQELKAGGPQVDVFASTDVSHCLDLKARGLLEKFTPANAATIVPEVQNQDPDGYFHRSHGIVSLANGSAATPGDRKVQQSAKCPTADANWLSFHNLKIVQASENCRLSCCILLATLALPIACHLALVSIEGSSSPWPRPPDGHCRPQLTSLSFSIFVKSCHWIHVSPGAMRWASSPPGGTHMPEHHNGAIRNQGLFLAMSGRAVEFAPVGDVVAALVKRAEDKNAAFMRGEMDRWSKLARIATDFTLMQPFGGPATYGYDTSPERLAELARYFRNGETKLEVAEGYASDRLVVLVMIERQHAEVGGLPGQDWSLRVTEVYRKDGSDWQLVHRHADPLVHRITLEQAAALARGFTEGEWR